MLKTKAIDVLNTEEFKTGANLLLVGLKLDYLLSVKHGKPLSGQEILDRLESVISDDMEVAA